jgi:RNA polymerase sigma-70 factor (ECF subfamily)
MLPQTLQPDEILLESEPSSPLESLDDIASLHALYEPRIFRLLLLSTRDRDLAQTLTQDTFLKVWSTRSQFRGECSIATWITRIALNLLRSHTRTETFRFWRRASTVDAADLTNTLPHNSRSAEALLIAQQSLAAVWESVAKLSPRQRSIFLLRYVEEFELSEISTAMNLPLPTVKTHLYRALDHVRAAHTSTRKARQ